MFLTPTPPLLQPLDLALGFLRPFVVVGWPWNAAILQSHLLFRREMRHLSLVLCTTLPDGPGVERRARLQQDLLF